MQVRSVDVDAVHLSAVGTPTFNAIGKVR